MGIATANHSLRYSSEPITISFNEQQKEFDACLDFLNKAEACIAKISKADKRNDLAGNVYYTFSKLYFEKRDYTNALAYVEYAKKADAWIAIDIFPEFETGDVNNEKCFIKTNWNWPIGDWSYTVTSGEKYTFLIHPDDVPENAESLQMSFLNYATYGSGIKDATFYVTAPYLYDVQNEEATTTTTGNGRAA